MLNQCFLMLVHRLLRWTSIKQTLVQRLLRKDVRPRGCPVVLLSTHLFQADRISTYSLPLEALKYFNIDQNTKVTKSMHRYPVWHVSA